MSITRVKKRKSVRDPVSPEECIGYRDYGGVAIDIEERERLVRDLGNRETRILTNHELLERPALIRKLGSTDPF